MNEIINLCQLELSVKNNLLIQETPLMFFFCKLLELFAVT